MRTLSRASALVGLACATSFVWGNGPDITHQDLVDAGHYGPVGTIHAYAWGSATCNIGDAALSWLNGGSPALAMNAYRLSDGRLTQIGVGFCKHACCASNGSGCGTCMSTGTGLRAGCRDVYSAGFNAGQAHLGPRSGINPFEGTFTTIANTTGDAIFRRVQVQQADMSLATFPNALYFGEGVYVCAEENPPEQLNNATYRRMTVVNSGTAPTYVWTPVDASRAGRPAIYAWRDHGLGANMPDTSVTIVTANVANEGTFFGAGKVTTLPGGLYRYDYAVFNLNSDRAGGSLTVPVATGVHMTDVGFHDVTWHSGEVFSNIDWGNRRDPGSFKWETADKYSVNVNGNAIRWGTMYNFWFTADVAPAANAGTLSLGLFKPPTTIGGPVSVDITGLPVPAPICVADFDDGTATGTRDGGVTVEDLLYYLGLYAEGVTRADIDGNAGVTIEDLLLYVSHYSAGC